MSMETLKKRKLVVAAVDGKNRMVEIFEMREVEVRNHIHLKNVIEDIEITYNERTNELKSKRLAAIRCYKVGSFKNVKVSEEAAALNQVFRKEEEKRQANTQNYLKYLKDKKAREASLKADKEAYKVAIVKYDPSIESVTV